MKTHAQTTKKKKILAMLESCGEDGTTSGRTWKIQETKNLKII